jgi:hypothetical protein
MFTIRKAQERNSISAGSTPITLSPLISITIRSTWDFVACV